MGAPPSLGAFMVRLSAWAEAWSRVRRVGAGGPRAWTRYTMLPTP